MPRKTALALLTSFCSIFLVASLPAQEDAALNLSMDKVAAGAELPEGWDKIGTYSVTIEENPANKSNRYLKIESGTRPAFGVARYFLPAKYAGEQVELTGKIKVKDVGRRGGARLRIVFFKNGRNILNKDSNSVTGTSEWKDYTISLSAPKDADSVAVVGFLSGRGTAWFDDFRLSTSPDASVPLGAETDNEFDNGSGVSRIPTDKTSLASLELLGRVWGYVKYHHPTVAAGKVNWDYELFRVFPRYLGASSAKERGDLLVAWIEELGEFETSQEDGGEATREYKLQPDVKWLEDLQSSELQSLLQSLQTAKRSNGNYYVAFSQGVKNPQFNEEAYAQFQYPDAGFRLLALYRHWNMVQYYFPYRTLTDKDWNDVLVEFIPRFANAKDALEYNLAATELIYAVQDTHAQVSGPNEVMSKFRGTNQGALQLRFIEGKLVVTGFVDDDSVDQEKVAIGDIVTKVNNIDVDKWVSENERYFPASNRAVQRRLIADNILRTNEDHIELAFRRGQDSFSATIPALERGQVRKSIQQRNSKTPWKVLDGNVGYLYPGSLTAGDVRRLPRQLLRRDGLVVDLRCYPSQFIVFSVGALLMPEPTEFVKFTQAEQARPGAFVFGQPVKVGRPNRRYFKGRVAILIDERTQSQAEYTTMALRVAPEAKVFGSTTAGADGNFSSIVLPGNIRTGISGLGVYTPEGKDTQRVGIIPDVRVQTTIEGIKSGKDEVLDAALDWLGEPDGQP